MSIVLTFFRRYVSRYWLWFVGGAIALFVTNWIAVQIPLQLAKAVDAMKAGGGSWKDVVWSAVWTIALMGAAVMVVRTLSRILFFTPGRLVEYQVKNDLFKRLLELQPSFYAEWRTGDIVSRASNDLTFLRVMVGFASLQIVNITAALILTGGQMLSLSPSLTLYSLIPIVITMILVNVGIRQLFDLMKKSQEELSELSEHILASLQGVQTIQGFNAHDAFVSRFLTRNQQYMDTKLKLVRIQALVLPLLVLGGAFSIWVLLAVGGPMTTTGELTVGQLVAFTSYIAYLLMPLRSLGWLVSVFQRGVASLQRINELLDTEPERPEGKEPVALPMKDGTAIELKGLSFAYPDAEEQEVLQDISVCLPAGKRIGIFGRTGSGKTTLLRILTRTYNPAPGTVFVNGVDLTTIDLDEWRKCMGVVTQVPFLFSDSIADNITMGELDQERLDWAVEKAALSKDIAMLPDGLKTIVGERGIMLSGGQRQRVSLARALYRDFDLLVLDDVLSAVDHKTEHELIETIDSVVTSRGEEGGVQPTTFLVSHRLSAFATADTVLVLDEGKLIDQGTHEELILREGPYRDAWEHQSETPIEPAKSAETAIQV